MSTTRIFASGSVMSLIVGEDPHVVPWGHNQQRDAQVRLARLARMVDLLHEDDVAYFAPVEDEPLPFALGDQGDFVTSGATFHGGCIRVTEPGDPYLAFNDVRAVPDLCFQATLQPTVGVGAEGEDRFRALFNLPDDLGYKASSGFNGLDLYLESINANGVTSGHRSTTLA